MGKKLFIAEKPSVARQFAEALDVTAKGKDGYIESNEYILTWCVGHLVTMSYPEVYDEAYKKWKMDTLPFLPSEYKYEVISSARKQFDIVAALLNREDVTDIYVCTDSGREGEYIYRLVEQEAHVTGKNRRRVWIDSQTKEEILRGIKEAKDLSEYDNLSAAAYLRAKEDYLMGINFSRVMTLKHGNDIARYLGMKYAVLSIGRVMSCVLGMVVRREREIRSFVKTPFYKVLAEETLEWKVTDNSIYNNHPDLYKNNGFTKKELAEQLIAALKNGGNPDGSFNALVSELSKKKETKNAPLLFNLAELQNECSRLFKISPDETLNVVQTLYERKLVTYPRTDARVLSSAIAKEIYKNISGLREHAAVGEFAAAALEMKNYLKIAKTKYVDDKKITDHYAIIPTGQGIKGLSSMKPIEQKVYELIARRFIAIFYPPAVYEKISLTLDAKSVLELRVGLESFSGSSRVLKEPGYLVVTGKNLSDNKQGEDDKSEGAFAKLCASLKKGEQTQISSLAIKEGETTPPKRYDSGSIILAMENAGQLIEDEELRAQIKGSGIGTSATRAEILKKLVNIKYIKLDKKSQIISPSQLGEMVFDVTALSMKQLLNPELTASWEKGLTYVANGEISSEEYMIKLEDFVRKRVDFVRNTPVKVNLKPYFDQVARFYR